jgi:hypothetical protein
LRGAGHPCYALLPWNEYQAYGQKWNLPDMDQLPLNE